MTRIIDHRTSTHVALRRMLLPCALLVGVAQSLVAHSLSAQGIGADSARRADARELDPSGTYDFTTQGAGDGGRGVLELRRTDGKWAGRLVEENVELPVRAVRVEGKVVTIEAGDGAMRAVLVLTFGDARFTGRWTQGESSGRIDGTRRTAR